MVKARRRRWFCFVTAAQRQNLILCLLIFSDGDALSYYIACEQMLRILPRQAADIELSTREHRQSCSSDAHAKKGNSQFLFDSMPTRSQSPFLTPSISLPLPLFLLSPSLSPSLSLSLSPSLSLHLSLRNPAGAGGGGDAVDARRGAE